MQDRVSLYPGRVKLVPGRRENIKITTPADRELAEFYLKKGTE